MTDRHGAEPHRTQNGNQKKAARSGTTSHFHGLLPSNTGLTLHG
jgi:hypothetical protein